MIVVRRSASESVAQSEQIENVLSRISEESTRLTRIAADAMQVGSALRFVDLLVMGAVKRTLNVTAGFSRLVRDEHMICARALLRMQVDTVVRFGALALVEDPEQFAGDVFHGASIRKLKSRSGQLLSDRYLVDQLSQIAPWLPEVYQDTSSYIHFSSTSIFAGMFRTDDATRRADFLITAQDSGIEERVWLELARVFNLLMAALIGMVSKWADTRASSR